LPFSAWYTDRASFLHQERVVSSTTSVTTWLERLKAGQRDEAAQRLWQTYFDRLVRRARALLGGRAGAATDEEDVALSAFDSFVRGVERGHFPRLDDRHDLWQVLLVLLARKADKHRRREQAQKRPRSLNFSALTGDDPDAAVPEIAGDEPDPAEAAALAEMLALLLARLGNDDLRQVAVLRLAGHSNAEIANLVGRHEGTVERRLQAIRESWEGWQAD
jgi:DNA-directed RNA polymerase specialized sigma24 family protein